MLNVLRKIVQDVTQEGSFAASLQLLAAHIEKPSAPRCARFT